MQDENAYVGYWRVYGGVWVLVRSTYFWVAVLITSFSKNLWLPDDQHKLQWVALATSILPCLIGFSLGGMAIMLAFSSGKFLDAVRQKGKANSYFMKMMASFFHFALVLTSSLMLTFIVQIIMPEYFRNIISCFGFFLSIYAILLILSIVSSIWHTARIFNEVRE